MSEYGWVCPMCMRIWSPRVDGCKVCNEIAGKAEKAIVNWSDGYKPNPGHLVTGYPRPTEDAQQAGQKEISP